MYYLGKADSAIVVKEQFFFFFFTLIRNDGQTNTKEIWTRKLIKFYQNRYKLLVVVFVCIVATKRWNFSAFIGEKVNEEGWRRRRRRRTHWKSRLYQTSDIFDKKINSIIIMLQNNIFSDRVKLLIRLKT